MNSLLHYCLRSSISICFLAALLVGGCSTSSESGSCSGRTSVPIEPGGCLVFEDNGRIDTGRDIIIQVITETFAAVNELMPIDDIEIRILVDPNNVIPEYGINGYNPGENEVIIYVDTDSPQFLSSLENNLAIIISHELHHAKRRRAVGYGSTLLQALISEGLADHFAVEVTGLDPPIWSNVLSESELENLIQTASQRWNESPYDHRRWFFGTDPEIPRWTGYSIGFELVRIYLSEHTGRKASNLFGEAAASFIPE